MRGNNVVLSTKIGRIALLIVLAPLIIPLALVGLILFFLNRLVLYVLIWLVWLPRGKDVLFVNSDSPIWHDYMAEQVLPLVIKRAVVLNWSQRENWSRWSFTVHVFRTFGGSRNFNPLVVRFPPLQRARYFRFLPAFIDWKHGDAASVEQLRQELAACL